MAVLGLVMTTTLAAAGAAERPAALAEPARAGFGFEAVAELARAAAARPYRSPETTLPAELAELDYDGLRDIRFRPERALWRAEGLPFEIQFFHRGGGFSLPVEVQEIVDGQPRPVPYDKTAWDYGAHDFWHRAEGWGRLGHAGFRIHHALNTPETKDELIVFLGASYFRALGRGQQYGLSARGLAIDTMGGAGPEEFPRFERFWIERPAADAKTLTVHALLDSPRATGAYRFEIEPGDTTTVSVRARVFLRAGAQPARLGLAPLTSMFQHGENQPRAGDFRPEVHDSDGLLLALGQPGGGTEWLWRPLVNPPEPLGSSFATQRLEGFGLMQRDRRFASYEDTEARYERRPSTWVEPIGDWGPGRVELLQLPTPDETEDNIVAYWAPERMPRPGEAIELAWRLHWQGDTLKQPPTGWTVQSRRGRGWAEPAPGEVQFNVDFDGPALRALPEGAAVKAVATATHNARVLEAQAFPHPEGGWRMHLRAQRLDPAQPLELRAFLQHGSDALTETWSALVPRDEGPQP
jgi:periplasmic glucans biosynthesis protein